MNASMPALMPISLLEDRQGYPMKRSNIQACLLKGAPSQAICLFWLLFDACQAVTYITASCCVPYYTLVQVDLSPIACLESFPNYQGQPGTSARRPSLVT